MPEISLTVSPGSSVSVADRVAAAIGRVRAQVDKLDKTADQASWSNRTLADRLTDIDKAAQIAGGPIAALTPRLNDFADGIEQAGLKSTVANVAMVGLASGGLALALAGVTALTAAGVGLAANAIHVSSNISAFDATLGANSETMRRNRSDLAALQGAQEDLSLSTSALQVELAGLAAPVLTELSYATAGLVGGMTDLAAAENEASVSSATVLDTTLRLIPAYAGLSDAVGLLWQGTRLLADAGRENAAALREQAGAANQYRVVSEDLTRQAESIEESWSQLPFDMVADSQERVRASVLAQAAPARGVAQAYREAAQSMDDFAFASTQVESVQPDLAAGSLPSAQVSGGNFGIGDAGLDVDFEQMAEGSDAATEQIVGNFQSISGAAVELHGMVVSAMNAMFEGNTRASLKERKKQFAAMKAAALLEAGINVALAVTNAFATAPNPIVGAVLAALVGAAGAVQIGLIAAKQPNFHRGGLLPDETYATTGAVIRRNERQAVITAQGMAAMGGESGLARINAGQSPASPTITLIAEGRTVGFREFAGADPGYGQRRRG